MSNVELAHDPKLPRQKHLVVLEFLDEQRRINFDLVAHVNSERRRELGAQDHRIIIEVRNRAPRVGETPEIRHALDRAHVDATKNRIRRPAVRLHTHHAFHVGSRCRHPGGCADLCQHVLRIAQVASRLNIHFSLCLHDHSPNLVAKSPHHARHNDQHRHAERHPQHRDCREKRKPPAREELFAGEIKIPGHSQLKSAV